MTRAEDERWKELQEGRWGINVTAFATITNPAGDERVVCADIRGVVWADDSWFLRVKPLRAAGPLELAGTKTTTVDEIVHAVSDGILSAFDAVAGEGVTS